MFKWFIFISYTNITILFKHENLAFLENYHPIIYSNATSPLFSVFSPSVTPIFLFHDSVTFIFLIPLCLCMMDIIINYAMANLHFNPSIDFLFQNCIFIYRFSIFLEVLFFPSNLISLYKLSTFYFIFCTLYSLSC